MNTCRQVEGETSIKATAKPLRHTASSQEFHLPREFLLPFRANNRDAHAQRPIYHGRRLIGDTIAADLCSYCLLREILKLDPAARGRDNCLSPPVRHATIAPCQDLRRSRTDFLGLFFNFGSGLVRLAFHVSNMADAKIFVKCYFCACQFANAMRQPIISAPPRRRSK